jgi:hypothetical protein
VLAVDPGLVQIKHRYATHNDGLLDSLEFDSFDIYEPCLLGKMTRTPFIRTIGWASDLLGLIHTDVCGPMSIATRNGYRYFVTFTDDLSRYGYFIKELFKSLLSVDNK